MSHLIHVLVIACIILTIALDYEGTVVHVARGKDNFAVCVFGMGCAHLISVRCHWLIIE